MMHYTRRRSNLAWSEYGVPSYSYNFDVTVNGMEGECPNLMTPCGTTSRLTGAKQIPDYVGATHFQEVAFVFSNFDGLGYDVNPIGDDADLRAVSKTMSTAWINFIVGLDPNGDKAGSGLSLKGDASWPVYDSSLGGGVGQNVVLSKSGAYVEWDSWRAEGINWMIENSQAVFGN
jgi:carboxylesterase type B